MPDALHFLVITVAGWVNRPQDDQIAYLREEHRGLLAWRLGRVRRVRVRPRRPAQLPRVPRSLAGPYGGLDATCGVQTGGVRPPPPGSRAYRAPLRGGASHEAER